MTKALVLVIAVCVTLTLRAADPVVTSIWKPDTATVDGSTIEWKSLETLTKGLEFAAANDGTSLYLVLLASTDVMRVSVARGLVFWFDVGGGHKETFGLLLPGPAPLDPGSLGRSSANAMRLTPVVSDHIDLLREKLSRRLIDLTPESGAAVATGGEDGAVVFELKVPLVRSDGKPLGLGTTPGSAISVGIATPPMKKEQEDRGTTYYFDPYAGARISGIYGPGPLQPPLPDSSNKPEKEVKPKNLDFWTTVRLAK